MQSVNPLEPLILVHPKQPEGFAAPWSSELAGLPTLHASPVLGSYPELATGRLGSELGLAAP